MEGKRKRVLWSLWRKFHPHLLSRFRRRIIPWRNLSRISVHWKKNTGFLSWCIISTSESVFFLCRDFGFEKFQSDLLLLWAKTRRSSKESLQLILKSISILAFFAKMTFRELRGKRFRQRIWAFFRNTCTRVSRGPKEWKGHFSRTLARQNFLPWDVSGNFWKWPLFYPPPLP